MTATGVGEQLQRWIEDQGAKLNAMGGILRCSKCGAQAPLGDTRAYMLNGWPKCCELNMTWVTARELAAARPPWRTP